MAEENDKKKNGYNFISIGIAVIALVMSVLTFVWFKYDLILKNRPYLHIEVKELSTWLYTDPETNTSGHRKIGIDIQIKNEGSVPASNVKFDWYIATDMDGQRMSPDEFYKMENKKMPEYGTVFPKQTVDLLGYNPDVSPSTKKLTLYVVASYEGVAKSILGFWGSYRKYWYLLKTEYRFTHYGGSYSRVAQMYYRSDWDREQSREAPQANSSIEAKAVE